MKRRLAQSLPILVLLVTLPLAWATARDGERSIQATGAAVPGVSDDDGGAPMFALSALAPGRSERRCIRVRFGGAAAGAVRLAGRVDGALAERIRLTVERGSGGDFEGCAAFRGTEVFDGTLAEFTAEEGAAWKAAEGEAATYRFTATAADDLPPEVEHAAATFTWHASALPGGAQTPPPGGGYDPPVGAPGPDKPPVHAGGPGTTGGPAQNPGTGPGGDGTRGGTGGGSRDAGGARGGQPGSTPGGAHGPDGAPVGAGPAPGGGPASAEHRGAVRRFLDSVAKVAADVSKRVAFPLLLLLLIALFLIIQHRIDKRDPKLALAPVHREHDLPFTPLVLGGPGE